MTCCAYFKDGRCIESMEAHITEGLRFIERIYIARNYGKFLSRVLGLKKVRAEELLLKAYAIHDVGKCLEEFQDAKQGFRYHEFYSALVAREVLKQFGKASEIATIAIFLHHHDWVREKPPRKPRNLKLHSDCIEVIEDLIGAEIPKSVPWTAPDEFRDWMIKVFSSNIRAVYALLLPISLADNYSALKNRGGEQTMLGKEVMKAVFTRREVEACLRYSR
ncbi:HD domain-containing protein [Pyrococcus yayanosii]|uniref:CRISPR-associated HD domain protein n=1 Tax=Pyrococcus yayanosii (strain CH1 / JCM 16557) TaxID=529709 RepID=F8AED5_PYRYC|nr:HD domain-containing protein [Pyrococcus yayanosii]AEH24651.1 CRISPR-associated HD domain protein [Pyrococcus yayanosii CH1]